MSVSADLHARLPLKINPKLGFVFDRDMADIRLLGIIIFKDPSFVHIPGSFYKYRRDIHLILIQKVGNVRKLIPVSRYSISRSEN